MNLLLPAFVGAPALNRVYNCDALQFLKAMPSESVNCIVTSPPYFGLRDYGISGQYGLEKTPAEYIAKLVMLFHEARRVLRSDGTCWINLGDSYANDDKWGGSTGGKHVEDLHGQTGIGREKKYTGLASKNLMMIPARVAIALQDDGWIIRSEIIWHKSNPMPESVTDRCTRAHEMIYMLTKEPKYWSDFEAIKETLIHPNEKRKPVGSKGAWQLDGRKQGENGGGKPYDNYPTMANKRDVWTIPTAPTPEAHFATFPPKLIEPMILAGCPVGGVCLDMFMGSGTTALVARQLGRQFVGCELNPEYVAICKRRLAVPYTLPMLLESEAV